MPVMKKLTVGGVTYDTVGEASIAQVLGSGTKIATVSIDGTSTDIYAPDSGGGSLVIPTYTITGETTATCDMTFADVYQAVEDGVCPFAIIDDDGAYNVIDLDVWFSSRVVFSKNYMDLPDIGNIVISHSASGIAVQLIEDSIPPGLPSVTSSDNGKVLRVVNGAWAAAELPIYDGTVI